MQPVMPKFILGLIHFPSEVSAYFTSSVLQNEKDKNVDVITHNNGQKRKHLEHKTFKKM